ncbi:MAG: hypothetical protein LBG27_04545 [Spirochaetaceae bacterium]|jgi:hypothetical protein|nr:hypothetical protein [Spirochaetaceae bacterium]
MIAVPYTVQKAAGTNAKLQSIEALILHYGASSINFYSGNEANAVFANLTPAGDEIERPGPSDITTWMGTTKSVSGWFKRVDDEKC